MREPAPCASSDPAGAAGWVGPDAHGGAGSRRGGTVHGSGARSGAKRDANSRRSSTRRGLAGARTRTSLHRDEKPPNELNLLPFSRARALGQGVLPGPRRRHRAVRYP